METQKEAIHNQIKLYCDNCLKILFRNHGERKILTTYNVFEEKCVYCGEAAKCLVAYAPNSLEKK